LDRQESFIKDVPLDREVYVRFWKSSRSRVLIRTPDVDSMSRPDLRWWRSEVWMLLHSGATSV